MAKLDRAAEPGGPVVTGLAAGGFIVGERRFPAGLILTPEQALAWSPPGLAALSIDDLAGTLDPRPEFLLLGTGATLTRPATAFAAALEARDIGLELMDSRAAARAWGVLRAEGRQIVAALLPWG